MPTHNIANKGFSGMRRGVARFNFSCILTGNRPQSLTGHIVKRYGQPKSADMRPIFLFSFLFGFLMTGFGQTNDKLVIIDYDKVIRDIYSSTSNTDLESKWDYEAVLLLDSSEIRRISKINPLVVKEFRDNFRIPILDKYKKVIAKDVKTISDLFTKRELLGLLLNNTTLGSDKKLDSKVYIKDNMIAVYDISGSGWSERNRIRITRNGLFIEIISQTVE